MVPRYCAVAPLDGPCCTSRAHPDRSTIPGITREGFAESPSECEATCFATTGCHAFSHSVKRRQCVFCSDCAAARQASAKSRGVFTGWRRQREGETFATLADAVDVSGHRFWPGQISVGNLSRTVAAAEAGACVTPRPCAAGAMAVAIVLRGETLGGKQARSGLGASAAQVADWPRLVEAQGSLEHDLALTGASREPAGRGLSQRVHLIGETFRWGCDAFGVAKQRQACAT